jgi:hypothetical protein
LCRRCVAAIAHAQRSARGGAAQRLPPAGSPVERAPRPCSHAMRGGHEPSRTCRQREQRVSPVSAACFRVRSAQEEEGGALAALGAHEGLGGRAGHAGRAEVLDGLAVALGAAQQHGAGAGGCGQCQLVERQHLAAGGHDARARRLGHAQRAQLQLGHVRQAHVVSHLAHQHSRLRLLALHERRQLAQAKRRAVDAAHEQPLQHNLAELAVRAASQELVQLHKQLQVHVVALRRRAVRLLAAPAGDQVDTHPAPRATQGGRAERRVSAQPADCVQP